MEVTSASKREQKLFTVAAAIPKLLVLIDGRSVYMRLCAGVYWDVQDKVLEDIERIEVLRGTAGARWGANAVNGVQNLIGPPDREFSGNFLTSPTKVERSIHFSKFVGWPANAFRGAPRTIHICLIGEDMFGKIIDETVRGRSAGGRGFVVRRLALIPPDDSRQIAFLGGMEKARAEQVMAPVKSLPILTVVDHEEGGEPGSMTGFVIEDRKVRFNINFDAAERAGLKMSAKLVKLATTVREKGSK